MSVPMTFSDSTNYHLKLAAERLIDDLVSLLDGWLTIKAELSEGSTRVASVDAAIEECTAKLDAARTAFAGLPETIKPDARFL